MKIRNSLKIRKNGISERREFANTVPTYSVEHVIERSKLEALAPLLHGGDLQPGVGARVVPEGCVEGRLLVVGLLPASHVQEPIHHRHYNTQPTAQALKGNLRALHIRVLKPTLMGSPLVAKGIASVYK